MSLRKDILDNLPNKVTDPELVHDLEYITNNYAKDIRNLTHNSLFTENAVIDDNTNWNNIELESYALVLSWKGQSAPSLSGKGIMFAIGSGQENEVQVAIAKGAIAFRTLDTDWSIVTNHAHIDGNELEQYVDKILNQYNFPSISNSVTSLASDDNHHQANINGLYSSASDLNNRIDINSENVNKLSQSTSSNVTNTDSLGNDMYSYVQSINSNLSAQASTADTKETKQEAKVTYQNVLNLLSQKQSIINGNLKYPDLNMDTDEGHWLIKNQALQNVPHTYYKSSKWGSHTDGLLINQPVGNGNLLQMVYFTFGNPDDDKPNSQNNDSTGAISYRFHVKVAGNWSWQAWNTIPYQKDLNEFESSATAHLSGLDNGLASATSNTTNYANGLFKQGENDLEHDTTSLQNRGDSQYDDALAHIKNNRSDILQQEQNNYNDLNNNLADTEGAMQRSAQATAQSQAEALANQVNSNNANSNTVLQGITQSMNTIDTNMNTNDTSLANQVTRLSNNTDNQLQSLNTTEQSDSSNLANDINNVASSNSNANNQLNSNLTNSFTTFSGSVSNSLNDISSRATSYTSSASSSNSFRESSDVSYIEGHLGQVENDIDSGSISAANSLIGSLASLSGLSNISNIGAISNALNTINSDMSSLSSLSSLDSMNNSLATINTELSSFNNISDSLSAFNTDIDSLEPLSGSVYSMAESYTPLGDSNEASEFYTNEGHTIDSNKDIDVDLFINSRVGNDIFRIPVKDVIKYIQEIKDNGYAMNNIFELNRSLTTDDLSALETALNNSGILTSLSSGTFYSLSGKESYDASSLANSVQNTSALSSYAMLGDSVSDSQYYTNISYDQEDDERPASGTLYSLSAVTSSNTSLLNSSVASLSVGNSSALKVIPFNVEATYNPTTTDYAVPVTQLQNTGTYFVTSRDNPTNDTLSTKISVAGTILQYYPTQADYDNSTNKTDFKCEWGIFTLDNFENSVDTESINDGINPIVSFLGIDNEDNILYCMWTSPDSSSNSYFDFDSVSEIILNNNNSDSINSATATDIANTAASNYASSESLVNGESLNASLLSFYDNIINYTDNEKDAKIASIQNPKGIYLYPAN